LPPVSSVVFDLKLSIAVATARSFPSSGSRFGGAGPRALHERASRWMCGYVDME
jgi:hypothetical protein